MNAMHPQLEFLLQLQDLKSHRRELMENVPGREVEEQEFHVNVEEAIASLDERIDEMKRELPAPVRTRLERFSAGAGRAVVPVINGICYGCFSALPTASMSALGRNDELNYCEQCGRFLYVVTG
ncbi:MAG TPA: C4-type zinc ribbon domain-containing protein [Longimicrobiales bacterium]|nr:C4-type zinc ribbon domain-containing protein [Longimicrobiales bacterium]